MTLVALVALLVIGPERLPKVARLAGFWVGKARKMVTSVKQEIKEELYLDEIQQEIKEHSPAGEIRRLVEETSKVVKSLPEVENNKSSKVSRRTSTSLRSKNPHGE